MAFLFGKFHRSAESIEQNIYYLKLIPLFFDFIAGIYLIKYLNSKLNNIGQSVSLSMFFFLNIAYFYDTLIWGQVDSINACLIFLAFFFAFKQRVLVTLIFILLGLNFKFISIMFLPLIGLMLLPVIVRQISLKNLASWILIPLLIQFLIFLPFILVGDFDKVLSRIENTIGSYPYVSYDACNFWHWIIKADTQSGIGISVFDYTQLLRIRGLTYKHIGLGLFFASGSIALFPLIKNVVNTLFYKQNKSISHEKLLIIASLIPLLLFFFSTEMMSRYSHMAFIFLAAYSLTTGKYFPYITGSIAYFLNMTSDLAWNTDHATSKFDPRIVALLYFICIVYLFFQLYNIRLFNKEEKLKITTKN
jgi:hypothetical protein